MRADGGVVACWDAPTGGWWPPCRSWPTPLPASPKNHILLPPFLAAELDSRAAFAQRHGLKPPLPSRPPVVLRLVMTGPLLLTAAYGVALLVSDIPAMFER